MIFLSIVTRSLRILVATMLLLLCSSSIDAMNVTRGESGQDVLKIQQLLINQGYLLDDADGIYGNNTAYSVKAFQKDMSLPVTGSVDDNTFKKLEQNNLKFLASRKREGAGTTSRLLTTSRLRQIEKQTKKVTPDNKKDLKKLSRNAKYAFGHRSEALKELQERLSINGYSTNGVDGIFGSGTVRAVKAFQKDFKLPITGSIDSKTEALIKTQPGKPTNYKKKMVMEASAYSAYDPGNGNRTARGNILKRGYIAVDPRVIPLGTEVYVEGYGYAVADDTGGAIKGKKVDLAMDSHHEAIQFGRKDVVVYIL